MSVLLLVAGTALADSMRCGQRLVLEGDTEHMLSARCGEPATRTSTVEERVITVKDPHGHATATLSTVVTVERWTYDFGPQRLLRQVTLVNGEITEIRVLPRP